jgi:hypothetical protein
MLAVVIILNVMDNEELEFENKRKTVDEFKIELKALMDKYNFGKYESNNYNGMDEYCGSDCYFTIDGETWYGETVSEILGGCTGF